jgi:hypothetical protein
VFLRCPAERNSPHSQSRRKASLLYVYVHVILSGKAERNEFHSQGRRKASLLCVFLGVFLALIEMGKSLHNVGNDETSLLSDLPAVALWKWRMSQHGILCEQQKKQSLGVIYMLIKCIL